MVPGLAIVAVHIALLLSSGSFSIFASADCVPYPVATRIGYVTLSNGQVARGAAFSVGTPEQAFAFLPQWPLNNIIVYGTNGYCVPPAPRTSIGCTTWRGGQYNGVVSTTRKTAEAGSYPSDPNGYPTLDFISDTLKINGNVTLPQISMGTPLQDWGQQGYYPMMAIGLGKNSTIMKALRSSGKIFSRTWSMWYGWTGSSAQTQVDGTLIFGGYDRAKVSGSGYTLAMTDHPGCETQLMVTIGDIILNFPNGSTASLLQSSKDSIAACIVPDYPVLMTMPLDPYFQAFQNLTGTSLGERTLGLAYYSMLYRDNNIPYTGDMTFKLQSGPTIRIPNHQLVVPNRYVDPSNGEVKANVSQQNLVINTVQNINAKDLPKLGRQFLSSLYLLVNEDQRQFTLWRSNPTNAVDLVTIDEKGNELTNFCSSDSGLGDSSTQSKVVPTGAIVGASVGAVAVASVFGFGIFVFFQRRRRQRYPSDVVVEVISPSQANVDLDKLKKDEQELQIRSVPLSGINGPDDISSPARDGYAKSELDGSSSVKSPGRHVRMQQHFELPG